MIHAQVFAISSTPIASHYTMLLSVPPLYLLCGLRQSHLLCLQLLTILKKYNFLYFVIIKVIYDCQGNLENKSISGQSFCAL